MSTSFVPAEWAKHKAIWTAFPANPDAWFDYLSDAQIEVAALIQVLAEGDLVKVLVLDEATETRAKSLLLEHPNIEIIRANYGDTWMRDVAPIFTQDGKALRFKTNGWGGKYIYEFDDVVGDTIAEISDKPIIRFDFVLEGGSVDQDGQGTLLTTAQCVLNPNRNPGWTKEAAEAELCHAFGAEKVIWIDEGLINDHTDGHIDNIVKFIAPGKVVCMKPYGEDDPNAAIYSRIYKTLSNATDARGRKLEIVEIPSPGKITLDGEIIPASHVNFIIGNTHIVMPTYGTESAEEAVKILQAQFDGHTVVGLPSGAILTGGGSFHCITQQEPQEEPA